MKKRWNPFNSSDPNWEVNIERVHVGLPPIDFWDMGVEYIYAGMSVIVFAANINR